MSEKDIEVVFVGIRTFNVPIPIQPLPMGAITCARRISPSVVQHVQQISRSFGTQFNGKEDEIMVHT